MTPAKATSQSCFTAHSRASAKDWEGVVRQFHASSTAAFVRPFVCARWLCCTRPRRISVKATHIGMTDPCRLCIAQPSIPFPPPPRSLSSTISIAQSHDASSGGRCPFRPVSRASDAAYNRSKADVAADSSSSDLLAGKVTPEGKGEQSKPRTLSEVRGKTLLMGELSLNRYPEGWTYKIRINQDHDLPPKRVPRWTVWLELPVGDSVSLEVRDLNLGLMHTPLSAVLCRSRLDYGFLRTRNMGASKCKKSKSVRKV